jgi:uncharacterized repeat protein (TIGR03803 family)
MQSGRPLTVSFAMFLTLTLTTLAAATPAGAQTGIALRSFSTTDADGYTPGVVIFDTAGTLYVTTSQGGLYNGGVVFKMTPRTGGGWAEQILHSFNLAAGDGSGPGGLVFDGSGNIYGSCSGGGAHGDGTVFKMIPQPDGRWSEHILYSFSGGYGTGPSNVVLDAAGNLYGTTNYGGSYGLGSIFELTRHSDGTWVENTIHSFPVNSSDGYEPDSGVILDAAGNIYGTTFYGGANICPQVGVGCGTVYKLSPATGGTWTEAILHAFAGDGTDGSFPIAGVVFDPAGNLYGTTFTGGAGSVGVIFELTPAGATWTETILHTFENNGDGILPGGGSLAADAAGNFYGTTQEGGNLGNGTIYKLTRGAGGTFTYATYFKFDGANGMYPGSNVTTDGHGNVFGPTPVGGAFGDGVLFAVKP